MNYIFKTATLTKTMLKDDAAKHAEDGNDLLFLQPSHLELYVYKGSDDSESTQTSWKWDIESFAIPRNWHVPAQVRIDTLD